MLSYRHEFHAGNHADVFKHATLCRILASLTKKDKPFSCIDTHAGAGIYTVTSERALKTGEAAKGILTLLERTDIPIALQDYLSICKVSLTTSNEYPGSPELMRLLSRDSDQVHLMELHTTEIEVLRHNLGGEGRIHIHFRDGFSGLQAISPPEPRRGLALIDPSYELPEDYLKAAETIISTHKKWNVGILILWYPLLVRRASEIQAMKDLLVQSGITDILEAELLLHTPDTTEESAEWGLYGSGMFIINPPWKLEEDLNDILPWLATTFGKEGRGAWSVKLGAPSNPADS